MCKKPLTALGLLVATCFPANAATYTYTYSGYSDPTHSGQWRIPGISATFTFEADSNESVLLTTDDVVSYFVQVSDFQQWVFPNERTRSYGKHVVLDNLVFEGGTPRSVDNYYLAGSVDVNGKTIRINTDSTGAVTDWYLDFKRTSNSDAFDAHSTRLSSAGFTVFGFDETYHEAAGGNNLLPTGYSSTIPGTWNLQAEKTVEHIIVLTHGWSPGASPTANYLSDSLKQAAMERLENENIDPSTVLIIDDIWSEAFTAPRDYSPALEGTQNAGDRLAQRINAELASRPSDAFAPTIHLIGHSLGTVVNARAASQIDLSETDSLLVTMLDTPREVGSLTRVVASGQLPPTKEAAARAIAGLYFYETIPASTGATPVYVENYFGEESLASVFQTFDGGAAFGQPIAGANPVEIVDGDLIARGAQVPDAGHEAVYAQFYRDLIGNPGATWVTPARFDAFGELPDRPLLEWQPGSLGEALFSQINAASEDVLVQVREDALPEVTTQDFGPLLDTRLYNFGGRALLAATGTVLETFVPACTDGACPLPVLNQSEIIDQWMHDLGQVEFTGGEFRLISNSPSSVVALLNADSVLGLDFEYRIDADATGTIDILVGSEVVFSTSGTQQAGTAYIDLLNYAGDQELTWRFNSDLPGGSATFGTLRFYTLIAVPEPSCIGMALLCLGSALATARFRSCL